MPQTTIILGTNLGEDFFDTEKRQAAYLEGMDLIKAEGIPIQNSNELACSITVSCQEKVVARLRELFEESGKGSVEVWDPRHPPFIGSTD